MKQAIATHPIKTMEEFDITKIVPRAKPKPKIFNPFPIDTRQFSKRMIREHYPDLEHKLIRD
jgi:hypothetical protein